MILTIQPRTAAASLSFTEIPAGMLDGSTLTGTAASEIEQEASLKVRESELINLSELALVICGHRGLRPDLEAATAEARIELDQVRFETECITWLIAGRLGVRAAAAGSLKGYLKHGELIPEFSRDRVLQTVDTIEDLFGGALAFGAAIREETPSLFEIDVHLAV